MITVICVFEHKWAEMGRCDFEIIKAWVSVPALPPLTSMTTSRKGHILFEEENLPNLD